MSTWKLITVSKLFMLDKNTWYPINLYQKKKNDYHNDLNIYLKP